MAACEGLPPEILEFLAVTKVEIFTYLDLRSVGRVMLTSKDYMNAANHSLVWERQLR